MNDIREFEAHRSGGVWHILNRLMMGAIVLAILVGGILAFIPISKQRNEESLRIEQLRAEIAKQKLLLARQTREEELLRNDPAYLETKARDKLDLMKPGETIIRLEPARSPAASAGKALKN